MVGLPTVVFVCFVCFVVQTIELRPELELDLLGHRVECAGGEESGRLA